MSNIYGSFIKESVSHDHMEARSPIVRHLQAEELKLQLNNLV